MYTVIELLLPSLFGLKIMDYLLKGLTVKNIIFYYSILLLLSQAINNIIVVSFFDIDKSLWTSLNEVSMFFSNYVLISIVINILLALIFVILIKNVKLEVEVEYAENSKENKTVLSENNKKKQKNRKKMFTNFKKHFKKNKNK